MAWKLKRRERYALIEEDTQSPRKRRGTFYIGPRHVKHHYSKEFVEFSYVTAPNFASEKDCRVFAQNSHIAIEVYDFYVKLFDPDYENVSVYDERFDVQYLFKTTPKEDWRSVDYYNPTIQVIPLEDGVEIKRIFDTDYGTQTLEISHVVRTGRRLKHNIKFTNKVVDSKTFRVVMKLAGITSNKVNQETITSEKHVVSPFFFVGEDNQHLKLTEYLWNLGVTDDETDEWTATTLKDIVFDVHAQGCKADIIIGNYTLGQDESLLIDPDSDTFPVSASADDSFCTTSTSYSTFTNIRLSFTSQKTGIRWQIDIPDGATITKAFLSFRALVAKAGSTTFRIQPYDQDSCTDFSSGFWTRAVMSEYVDFTISSGLSVGTWYGGEGQTYETDIKTLVQVFIDRDGYSPDNYIGVRCWYQSGIGSASWQASSWDDSPSNAAKLEVTWEGVGVDPPTVQTNVATNKGTTTARLNGEITATGGEDCTTIGFEWDTDTGSPYANDWTDTGSWGVESFSHLASALNPNDTYYYRAKAANSAGWGYGSEATFDTLDYITKDVSGISGLKENIKQFVSNIYSSSERIFRSFDIIDHIKSYRTKVMTIIFQLKTIVSQSLSLIYSSIGRIVRILFINYPIGSQVEKILAVTFNSMIRIFKDIKIIFHIMNLAISSLEISFGLREFIYKSFNFISSLIQRISRILSIKFELRTFVPKIIVIKYDTKATISRILSTKFGIRTFVERIISFVYSAIGFYIIEVTCTPSKVHRAEVESWTFRCDWHDEADLEGSSYKCEFWIRDEDDTIHGPYTGSITKESVKEYHATYDLDPDETFLLGKYDVRAEVTKYD